MIRITTLTFAVFYLIVSTGLTLDMHFCTGKVVDVAFFSETDACCGTEGSCMENADSNCCDDETVLIQLDEWQISSSSPAYKIQIVPIQKIVIPSTEPTIQTGSVSGIFTDLPPPKPEPLWLLYGNLTYYS